jgi:hypothetical protein
VQAVNFFVTGTLILAFALSVRQTLHPQKLLPALLGLMGLGLIAATFFATEPSFGCPPGPITVPPGVSINGPVHDTAAGFVWICFMVVGLLCARRAFQQKRQGFTIYSIVSVVAMLGFLTLSSLGYAQIPGLLDLSGLFERLALLTVFAWITLFAISLLRGAKAIEAPRK